MMFFPMLGAWWASERARDVMADVQDAIKEAGKQQAVAAVMGVTEAQLSRWFNDHSKPNLVARLALLGEDWERRFIRRRAVKCGLRVVDADLADVMDAIKALADEREQERRTA